MEKETKAFFTRHAESAKKGEPSNEYPTLTKEGAEQAKEKARNEILKIVEDAPDGSIIFIGGASDQPRTKDTAKMYGDELSKIKEEKNIDDLLVITMDEIQKMAEDENKGPGQIVRAIKNTVDQNPDKKIVIDYPLFIKQIAYKYKNWWADENGNKSEYFSEVHKKHNKDDTKAGIDWIENEGQLELEDGRIIQGPNPTEVAEAYLEGIKRLQEFVNKNVPDRPVTIGSAGHLWASDVLVTYLANNGVVDRDGFKKVNNDKFMDNAELSEFVIDNKGVTVKYRGKDFNVEKE